MLANVTALPSRGARRLCRGYSFHRGGCELSLLDVFRRFPVNAARAASTEKTLLPNEFSHLIAANIVLPGEILIGKLGVAPSTQHGDGRNLSLGKWDFPRQHRRCCIDGERKSFIENNDFPRQRRTCCFDRGKQFCNSVAECAFPR